MRQKPMLRSIRPFIASLILILLGTAVAFMAAEFIVRIFIEEPILPRFVTDPGYGVRATQPNIRTRHYVPGDYDITITTNSAGLRGQREYTIEKPAGVYRIVLIGDSFVFGGGVNDNEVISHVLEDELNKSVIPGGPRYQVINFGVSGFGQAEELVTYRARARDYKADDVILFYFENDIGNNAVSELFNLDDHGRLYRTGNEFLPGVAIREELYKFPPTRWLFTHSQAWNLIRNRLSAVVQNYLVKKQGLKQYDDASPRAVELTRALFHQFIREIKDDGASPMIFVIPGKSMRSNFPLATDALAKSGIIVFDGRNLFSPQDYYRRDAHWTAEGNRKAAAAIARLYMNQR
jgi:hypothetical protein